MGTRLIHFGGVCVHTCLIGIRVMDGVMFVGNPVGSELLGAALSPDWGELGPSPFIRDSVNSLSQ